MRIKTLFRKTEAEPRCAAVIVAAGSAQRMGSDKILGALGGLPVLVHTLRPFQRCDLIEEIVVVTRAEKLEHVAQLCEKYALNKVSKVICGGATRAESALAGVSAVSWTVAPDNAFRLSRSSLILPSATPARTIRDEVE